MVSQMIRAAGTVTSYHRIRFVTLYQIGHLVPKRWFRTKKVLFGTASDMAKLI